MCRCGHNTISNLLFAKHNIDFLNNEVKKIKINNQKLYNLKNFIIQINYDIGR